MQNELTKKLPASFIAQGVEATIPIIPTLTSPFKEEVQNAFGEALKVVWQVVLGVSIAAFLCNLGLRQVELHSQTDEEWGREDKPLGMSSSTVLLIQ